MGKKKRNAINDSRGKPAPRRDCDQALAWGFHQELIQLSVPSSVVASGIMMMMRNARISRPNDLVMAAKAGPRRR